MAASYGERFARWLRAPEQAAEARGWSAAERAEARWALQVHGVAPLLHEALRRSDATSALPGELRSYLAEQHDLSGLKMVALLGELDELLAAAAAAGLALMPLKGALLARRCYASPGLRPCADTDLLTRDLDAALALLAALRYEPQGRSPRHLSLSRPERRGPVVSYQGEHPDNPRELELHARIGLRFWSVQIDITKIAWERSVVEQWPEPGGGRAVPVVTMDAATLLLHLALHTAEDMIARRLRLLQLHDIALLAAQLGEAEWGELVALAQSWGEERLLYAPLSLTARSFGGIPAEVTARLRAGTHPALRAHIEGARLDALSLCTRAPTSVAERLVWFRPGVERARALRHAMLPSPGELAVWFPQQSARRMLPLAYARYAGLLSGWALRRALGGRRLMSRQRER